MDVNSLILKWNDISDFKNLNEYKALRISSKSIPDLFIATNEDGHRCLLLFLPNGVDVRINGSDKEKLNLTYLKDQNIIVIKLNDSDFFDLFNDLIISLYSKIESISDPNIYSNELILSFYKWAEFFEDQRSSKLTLEKIKGLVGELFVLNELLNLTEPQNINMTLKSWKGPYDNSNDFVFDDKNIEVKTKENSQQLVKISSEFQLEDEFGKGLELIIVSVKIDLMLGVSINDLLSQAVTTIRYKMGDLTILYNAINQIGLTIESSKEYNNHRFVIIKLSTYNCAIPSFPKLSFSNIPQEITNLNYNLRTSTLNDFLTYEKKY